MTNTYRTQRKMFSGMRKERYESEQNNEGRISCPEYLRKYEEHN
jgi:hypothetical protein